MSYLIFKEKGLAVGAKKVAEQCTSAIFNYQVIGAGATVEFSGSNKPDYDIDNIPENINIKLLLIPGGLSWDNTEYKKYCKIIRYCLENNILTAAICNGVTFLADNGFLDNRRHTGNTLEYLKQYAPAYKGDKEYVESQSFIYENLITANGSAAVEFSRDILKKLNIFSPEEMENWFYMYKKGFL